MNPYQVNKRSLNFPTVCSLSEDIVKEHFKESDERKRRKFMLNLIKFPNLILNDPKIQALSERRRYDSGVDDMKDLSCEKQEFTEVRRKFAFNITTSEELHSADIRRVCFANSVRVLLSILWHHNIDWSFSWVMETACFPSPVVLVECIFLLDGELWDYYRVDISRFCQPIWRYQHIFYKIEDNDIRNPESHSFNIGGVPTKFERVGPGKPMCWQELRLKHGIKYDGCHDVTLLFALKSTYYSQPKMIDSRDVYSALQRSIYDEYDVKRYELMIHSL